MSRAEAFHCAVCGRRIGARRTHVITEGDFVVCTRCAGSAHAHQATHPTCRQSWHDLFDHPHIHTTRAGARSIQKAHRRPPESSKHDDHPSKLPTQRQVQ
jgi:ribosome-binding protein aMBF1 (putative translation factor)